MIRVGSFPPLLFHEAVFEDLKKGVSLTADPDLPGSGRHYCISCARHFIGEEDLRKHQNTKMHKQRLKRMKEKPHTQDDAELFAGMTQDKWWQKHSQLAGPIPVDGAMDEEL